MKQFILLLTLIGLTLCSKYFIVFKDRVDFYALQDPYSENILDRDDLDTFDTNKKAEIVIHNLKTKARLQDEYCSKLSRRGIKHKPYWIVNSIFVENPDPQTLNEFKSDPNVEFIEDVTSIVITNGQAGKKYNKPIKCGPTPNIWKIGAVGAWLRGALGQGIVVGVLDSGVNYKHKDIVTKYRGYKNNKKFDHDYNWYDGVVSRNVSCKGEPCDETGHGSHVTGLIVGSNLQFQIGVAPKAQWIACRSFYLISASVEDIANCLQWFLEPTKLDGSKPNIKMRPHIINHSWSSSVETQILEKMLHSLEAAGIMNVIAAGNSGPRCGSIMFPGSIPGHLVVGALDEKFKKIGDFSARGPTKEGFTKPDVVAPGEEILSISAKNDEYVTATGTSMATPHVTGIIALTWSANKNLIGKIALTQLKVKQVAKQIQSGECKHENTDKSANNVYGHGLVDAYATVFRKICVLI